jgi:hypothetical protein
MTAQKGQFSRVALIRVIPDRGSCAICGGRLSAITLQKLALAESPEGDPESRLWVADAGRVHGRTNGPTRRRRALGSEEEEAEVGWTRLRGFAARRRGRQEGSARAFVEAVQCWQDRSTT